MELTKPSAILFDWDNTLVDTWPLIHQALHATQTKWGHVPWSLQEVKQKVGKSMRDSFPEMFGESWEDAGDFYLTTYRSFTAEQLKLLHGAMDLLEYLSTTTIPVGLVSNKMGESLRREVKHLGLEKYFHTQIGAGDAKRDKPHKDPAELALKHLQIPMNQQVWFVGDTTTDLGCAHAGGMSGVLYGDVATDADNTYQGHNFAHNTKNHAELIELLRKY